MNSLDNYEITGQIEGQPITDSAIQSSDAITFGLQHELGLLIVAKDSNTNDQAAAVKTIEIMLDDMSFNLSAQTKLTSDQISNCLHESVENINDYLLEHNQLNAEDISTKGISLTAIQLNPRGIHCCMHGDTCCLKLSNDSLEFLGSKVSKAKSLGINSALTFTISEHAMDMNDILFLSSYSLVDELGQDFIRMTLARFTDNLYMAIRQINARATQKNILPHASFLLCRKTSATTENKSWFNTFS